MEQNVSGAWIEDHAGQPTNAVKISFDKAALINHREN
jgi:hypothetical protein